MKNQKMILGIGAIIIAILAVLFLIPKKSQAPTIGDETANTQQINDSGNLVQNTLSGLLAMGKNSECTFSYDENGVKSQGTIYLSGKKIRGDFSNTVQGKQQESSMINDGEYTYFWGSDMPQGVKMKISGDQVKATEETKKYYDPDRAVNYDCKSWNVNNAYFTAPSNVTFTDFSEMMEGLPTGMGKVTGMPDLKASQCAACDSLSGDAKTQCKTALGCN